MRVIFDDQQNIVALLNIRAIVLQPFDDLLHIRNWQLQPRHHVAARSFRRSDSRRCRSDVRLRNVQRKGASLPGRASQLNLATQQTRQFAADSEPEARTAILAACSRIGLLERLEDDALLVLRNPDAGIRDLERNHRARTIENRMTIAPSGADRRNFQPHAALLGELECVRQQILQHLLQTFRVRNQAARQLRRRIHLERHLAVLRLVTERPRQHIQQASEEDLLRVDRHSARLDLRKIQNVRDQVEQVGAGTVNRPRELDLLAATGCHPDCP